MLRELIAEYQRHCLDEGKNSCLKIHYQYNGVNVNLFFDAYDSESLALCVILNDKNEYYLTPLNIHKILEINKKPYLKECPKSILRKLCSSEGKLDLFDKDMREHIRYYLTKSKEQQINLKCEYSDESFQKALEKSKNKQYNTPFLHHIRSATMSKEHFIKLGYKLNISKEVLMGLQQQGRTIVTTNDPSKRRKLTIILKEIGYEIQ